MVKAKIFFGIAVIVMLGLLSMLYIYRGLDHVAGHLAKLDEAGVPFSIAAIEMEKNAGEYALGVLRYLTHPDPAIRTEALNDKEDYERYHTSYMQASVGSQQQDLGRYLAGQHQQLTALGKKLMNKRNQLDTVFEQVTMLLVQIDERAEQRKSQDRSDQEPTRSKTLAAVAGIEEAAAEVGFLLAAFEHRQSKQTKRHLLEKIDQLENAITRYRRLNLGPAQRQFGAGLATSFDQIKSGIGELLAGERGINNMVSEFVRLQNHIDDIFDDQVQVLAEQGLTQPQIEANKDINQVKRVLQFLIPLYLLAALIVGGLLNLTIIRPLRRLASGTKAIGGGNLEYRVAEQRRDEFGYLAHQFNLMVERLQESTVSRESLEASERQLQRTVAELRQEIKERQLSERKREQLKTELQRSEAMAAMGRLVAGVAHEVRNPLFGISSTLDAMEASATDTDPGKRYREVLRREAERLNTLMTNLLEYGKPPTNEFTIKKLGGIIEEAIGNCMSIAAAAGVTLVNKATDDGLLHMNHGRLLLVFVNLIDNAVRYAPEGTDVIIDTRKSIDDNGKAWLECSVSDAGAGFACEDLPYVFDPFFSRRHKGTGLGLAIVGRIVEEHNAAIEARNRAAGGAVVIVRMPLA